MCVRDFLAAILTPTTLTTPPSCTNPHLFPFRSASNLMDTRHYYLLYLWPKFPVSGALWGSTAECRRLEGLGLEGTGVSSFSE